MAAAARKQKANSLRVSHFPMFGRDSRSGRTPGHRPEVWLGPVRCSGG